jgi:ribosome-interacting GTPase 1
MTRAKEFWHATIIGSSVRNGPDHVGLNFMPMIQPKNALPLFR